MRVAAGLREWRVAAALIVLLLLAIEAFAGTPNAVAQEARVPLFMQGKKTLFQRVIVHPGAVLYAEPDAAATVRQATVKPFSVLYVYAVKPGPPDPPQWFEVGAGTNGRTDGWLAADKASEWRQSLVLQLTERTGREPVLFLRDEAAVHRLATVPEGADEAKRLGSQFDKFKSGSIPADFPALAREPADVAVPRDRFYLLPIFRVEDAFSPRGNPLKLLEVASIDPGSGPIPTLQSTPPQNSRQLKTAIAFVLDTTQSMDPYLDRVRQAIGRMYQRLEQAGQLKNVTFAVVAFRNSVKLTPGLEYVTKVFANFDDGADPKRLLANIKDVKGTTVSSHSFNEDAFAGIKTALDQLDWKGYGGHVILFMSDAGAIRKEDSAGQTHMNEAEIGNLAQSKQVNIFVFHLLTPAGKRVHNHEPAAQQYRALTQRADPTLGDFYVPIQDASVERFGAAIEAVATQLIEAVRATAASQRLPPPSTEPSTDPVSEAARKAAALGYALQLEFLGRKEGTEAPKVVHAFVSDRDLVNPARPAFEVSVLLTRLQLSDLHDGLNRLLAEAERAKKIGAADFFQRLASAAAEGSRDPKDLNRRDLGNLQQLGLFGEYLDDLPYKSKVLTLTQESWGEMSIGEQQDFIDEIESKMKLYESYDEQTDGWESFGARNPNDAVFRVPLAAMP